MPYYYHGSDLVYTDNGSLGASKNSNTKKCPNCHRETHIDSEKCSEHKLVTADFEAVLASEIN